MRKTSALIAALCFALQPVCAAESRSYLDIIRELIARHPLWSDFGDISPQFVVLIPLDEGVTTSPVDGGPKRIARDPEIYLYATSSNETHSLRGELRVLKKDGKHDVLEAFKKLKVQEVGETDTFEKIVSGDRLKGRYILVYGMKEGTITNEKIMNLYEDFAVSYRITTKPGGKEEDQAQNMVADFTILRNCSQENLGDIDCVRDLGFN